MLTDPKHTRFKPFNCSASIALNTLATPHSKSLLVKNSYADDLTELKKKRAFRKFSYRGVDLDQYVRTWLVSNELKP